MFLRIFDCDNPTKPERDEPLGDTSIPLDFLRTSDSVEFTEALATKGKVVLEVTWVPPAPEDAASAKLATGDERVVIGKNGLILREGFNKSSTEILTVPPETWVQLHEIRETEDGFRAHVRIVPLARSPS